MNQRTMERIDAALGGRLSPEEFDALQQELRDDPTALDHYCQQAEIHGRLEWELCEAESTASAPPSASRKIVRFPKALRYAAAAAALLAAGFFFGTHYHLNPAEDSARESGTPSAYVARLIQQDGAKWKNNRWEVGEWIASGPMELTEGSAQLAFDSGASLRLQAPARIHVASPLRARLDFGKAAVDISNLAAGFVIETPTAEFQHRGSRFGLAVEENGHTELHVLSGEVELNSKRGSRDSLLLAKDKAKRVGQEGITQEEPRYASADFGELLSPDSKLTPKAFLHWNFDVINPAENLLQESGRRADKSPAYPASIMNMDMDAAPALVPGQFGSAVKLDGATVLSTRFPGYDGSSARTVSFWIMIPPGTPDQYSYSILSWGTSSPYQGGKWQVAWNTGKDNAGRKGAIRTEIQGGYSIGSTDLRDGKWHHIAVVFPGGKDATTRDIRYYIDGRLDPVTAVLDMKVWTRIDGDGAFPLSVGNRVDHHTREEFRSFKGSIDELYIFPVALLPSQIEDLFLYNHPPALR